MHRTTTSTAAIAGVLLLLPGGAAAAATASHVEPTPVDPPLSSAVLLRHAVHPALATDDDGGVLLAAERGTRPATRSVVASFRGPRGHWSRVTVLGRGVGRVAAAGGSGRAVVGWSSYDASPATATVRLRDTRGRWSTSKVLVRNSDAAYFDDADMNRHGGVALLAGKGYAGHRILSRRAGGSWRNTKVPGCDQGDLALDDRGVVHLACLTFQNRGEESTGRVWTLAPGGRLTLERRLGKASAVEMQVAPDGRETLTVGVGTDDYPQDDSELVPARAFHVLRQATPGGALTTVWSRQRTVWAEAATVGDRLQVTFEEWQGTLARTCCSDGPATTLLRTQAVLPTAGPVTTLDEQAYSSASEAVARYDADVAVPAAGAGAILWRIRPDDDSDRVGGARLTPLTGTGATAATVVLPGDARNDSDQAIGDRAQLAVTSPGRVRIAWMHDVVTRRDREGDRLVTDGTVEVARLP